MGDFSGRANAGTVQTGATLAARRPIVVDVDNIDDVLARMKLHLSLDLADDGAAVSVPINGLDDFHPDQLVENVALFEALVQLRRDLASKAGFARAAKEVLGWSGESALPPTPRHARGAAVATDRKLSDFARLTGRPGRPAEASPVDALLRRVVGPYVQPARDAQQPALVARVDEAMSVAMRRVLHHPDFQAAEALWRGVELLVRRIETNARLQIVLYDVSAEELAADLASTDTLTDTGLFGMLAEAPKMDADQGALAAVIGLYGFELSPPHADLLGRLAQVAAAAGAPFLAGIQPDTLQTRFEDQHILIRQAWSALWELPASAYLGLATPRFLLRMPYGKRSDPIDAFAFEEFTREAGLSGMLWGHPALIGGLLLAQSWSKTGAKMQPGQVAAVGDMPYYVYKTPEGDQVALPCTERLFSERQASQVAGYHVMPLVTLRGRPEIRLSRFSAVGGKDLAGFWAPVPIPASGAPPVPPKPEPVAEVAPPAARPEPVEAVADTAEAPEPQSSAAEPETAAAADDLDALLASLNTEAPPAEEGTTEMDLDALLASL
jgi:type VI secretion system protein ImpC